jgi:hypothetical protein
MVSASHIDDNPCRNVLGLTVNGRPAITPIIIPLRAVFLARRMAAIDKDRSFAQPVSALKNVGAIAHRAASPHFDKRSKTPVLSLEEAPSGQLSGLRDEVLAAVGADEAFNLIRQMKLNGGGQNGVVQC